MGRNVKRWQLAGAPTESQLDQIAALLRSGGIVLLPTDTIYGLHALANDASSAKIAATDQEIDQLVYQLYEITDEEQAIIEGG